MSKKRERASFDSAIMNVWRRELGQLSSRNFANRLTVSKDLVLRLDVVRKLDRHRGCVNTISFNASGDVLVSGSDDRNIILWDWESGKVKLSFHSGHINNVFQAKMMPYSDDRSIVTCAADGQVRHAQIIESVVETKLLAKHEGRVHKLAIEPGSPHNFYTCGEDGLVQHIDLRTRNVERLFTCRPLHSPKFFTLHLYAITIDPRNPNLFAVGGGDAFARVYDIRKFKGNSSLESGQPVDFFCPTHLLNDESVGITGLTFSDKSELLVSYSDEFIYLFTKDLGLGPTPTFSSQVRDRSAIPGLATDNVPNLYFSNIMDNVKAAPQSYKGHLNCETVKGVNFFGPKCEYIVSGSDCGGIFIWNKKDGELVRYMKEDKDVVNCVEPHPHSTVFASSGIEDDIKIWIPNAIDRAILPTNINKFDDYDGDFTCSNDNEDVIGEEEDDVEDSDHDDNEMSYYDNDDEYISLSSRCMSSSSDDDDSDDGDGLSDDDNDAHHDNNYRIIENHDHGSNDGLSEQLEGEDDDFVEDFDEDDSLGSDTS